ncbi:uncharacterized protein LOC144719022 isoform X2 [Lampetra planeri]
MSASTFEPAQTVEAAAGGSETMSEHFVKPGNLDRGWNDPPVFSFCTQNATRRGGTPLTKRVPPPQLTGGAQCGGGAGDAHLPADGVPRPRSGPHM